MRLDGRRESTNVEDRRSGGGMSGGGKASLGIGGMIIVALLTWVMGGNPLEVLQGGVGGGEADDASPQKEYVQSEEEAALFSFTKKVFASTEDVWTELFKAEGLEYTQPKMVIYRNSTRSGCGQASSSTGPFYCPADQTVYIDLSFFDEMERSLGAGGDFAYAYVIAHEVGHHVQYLLGNIERVNRETARLGKKEGNRLSVRLELQADYLAGVWANHENERWKSLQDGDLEEAINAASQVGDDRLQKAAGGSVVPDAFTHGTSAQRMRWLKRGYQSGKLRGGDTFSVPYDEL
ncbi:metalloprotease [Tannerella sp. oral taxon BU063 isolate Cell 6/7/9]|jgi:hypothetical protein|uniref:Metalloprotease n=2 Tax=Tannerella serpentiformis TaxID=712710 RepID=W2CH94_9BACT|nr:metalloprotease [Tannerella sp. oral taxon BU063 isolate Cell 1/3]ETK09814.1 metalloprotease [Tannerella sp. oral taxon BU063 isolate Cell 6/7/9]